MGKVRFFQTIQARFIIIYVLLILIAMQLIGVYFVKTLENTFENTFSQSLNNQVELLTKFVEPYLEANQEGKNTEGKNFQQDLEEVVKNLNTISKAEIQIIDSNGIILSTTSLKNRVLVGQKTTQTEVSRALQGIKVDSGTIVDAAGIRYKVLAMPIGGGGKVLGAVYMVASMEDLFDRIKSINRIFVSGTLIALVLTVFLGVILAHTITNPIKEITKQATVMAEGDFNRQVNVVSHDEIGQLGYAFNNMTNRLKEALSLNEEEKEKLSSILANMSDGVIATDNLGKVIVANSKAKRMLKLQEEDLHDIDIADVLGMMKEQTGKYVLGENKTTMIELSQKDEEPLQIRVTFTPIHRRGKGVTGTIAVLQDVTEQEKLEQSRKEFVANVSHELRTPLTTIKSYLEALDDGAIEDPALSRKFVTVTRNEAERMIRLVTDLLQLSRLDNKQEVLTKEPTDMYTMLEEVADRFSFQLRQKLIEISVHADGNLPPVMLDPDQIDQVLDNLVSNAIKYTQEGGMIEIMVKRPMEQQISVTIADTGIGIPKKDLQKIFDRFYRADKARSRSMGGTGLGLSIAREIIRAHGGAIAIESELGKGTSVTFVLPLQQEGSEPA